MNSRANKLNKMTNINIKLKTKLNIEKVNDNLCINILIMFMLR